MKICRRCGVEKSIAEFSLDRAAADGHRPHCKSCRHEIYIETKPRVSAVSSAWYRRNKPEHQRKSIAYYYANKAKRSAKMAEWYQRTKAN